MDIGQTAGPLVTGGIVMATGNAFGFLASFLLTDALAIVFAISVQNKPG
ncbi:MAG: hypothetical protein WCF90_00550 [Methanomicrobiales archaeon]